jgi:hypothetical protein
VTRSTAALCRSGGYPSDYFRFSTDALALFIRDAGLEIIECACQHRVSITLPPELTDQRELKAWNERFPSWAVVDLVARKSVG